MATATVSIERSEGRAVVALAGRACSSATLEALRRELAAVGRAGRGGRRSRGRSRRIDTAGAWVIVDAAPPARGRGRRGADRGRRRRRRPRCSRPSRRACRRRRRRRRRRRGFVALGRRVGEAIAGGVGDLRRDAELRRRDRRPARRPCVRPWRLRCTSLVHHMQEVGLNAVPIVALMAFLIGVVLAFQGAAQLRQFGAEVFVVDLIAISVLRELGILMTAIIVAGRSASAFTAAIGSMKMREEIDAMRTLGLDPIEVLVVPRVLALVMMLPLLGFVANMAGLVGGALMAWIELGISPGDVRGAAASSRPTSGTSWSASSRRRSSRAIIGAHRLLRGPEGRGQRRIARPAHLGLGGAGDLLVIVARRAVLDLLRAGGRLMAGATPRARRSSRCAASSPASAPSVVHDGLDLDVYRGEVLGVVGGSGTGKSVLLRAIVGLIRPAAGTIRGLRRRHARRAATPSAQAVERRWGVMFQDGALFSSLTVRENVEAPMREHLDLDAGRCARRSPSSRSRWSACRRTPATSTPPSSPAACASAPASRARWRSIPEIVFLDEPTAGLDPIGAADFDELIRELQEALGPHRVPGHPRPRHACTRSATASRCWRRRRCW